ncbi:MAG: EamA family transporter, partial [Eubacteriales bacterium]|nr:EamA family transporter [Eubacteriales bacterium]
MRLIYVLFTAMVFACLEPLSKLLAGNINALALTFWRFLISSALLLPAALSSVRKRKIHLSGKNILAFSCQGVL